MNPESTKILVVDDSLTVRMDLTEALEAAQLQVTACTTIAAARDALSDERFGLIILDVVLPDGDGVDLLGEIRESAVLGDLAVILLSDESQVRDRIRGLATGADEYVGKPYDTGYVVARAQELLKGSRTESETPQETILVIDDSLTFSEQLKEALEGEAYRVLTAGSGEAGLRLAAYARPAVIVVDRTLPGIDGLAVLRGIRMDAALRHIPCILLTASEDKSDEVMALEAGADVFVRKDEDSAIILARIKAASRGARDTLQGEACKVSLQSPKRILVVDDNEDYLQHVTKELRDEGYEVVQARSDEETFDLLSAQSVDCILLDLYMPGIGSHEVCHRIKRAAFSGGTPVIMTTGRQDRETILRCLEAGADDYADKSAEIAALRARVLAQLRRRQIEDENRLIREQLTLKEVEARQARAARELGALQARTIERYQSDVALWELYFGSARASRWVAMDLVAARCAGAIDPATAEIQNALEHARRAAQTMNAPQTPHLIELLDKIDGHCTHIATAIRRTRAQIGRHLQGRAPEDINEIVETVMDPIARSAEGALDVTMVLGPDLSPVCVDKAQIEAVFAGLMRSSLERMRKDRCRKLAVTTTTGTRGRVQVAISGTGAGEMSGDGPDGCDFETADSLDAAIFRSVLESHGGRIWSAADKDAGRTITFELPASAAAAD